MHEVATARCRTVCHAARENSAATDPVPATEAYPRGEDLRATHAASVTCLRPISVGTMHSPCDPDQRLRSYSSGDSAFFRFIRPS
jgi:hypothetical protein